MHSVKKAIKKHTGEAKHILTAKEVLENVVKQKRKKSSCNSAFGLDDYKF